VKMNDCYVLEAENLLHYAGDLTHRRSGLLLWRDHRTKIVSFAVRYWLNGADLLHTIPFLEVEYPIPFGPGYKPELLQLRVATGQLGDPMWRFVCPRCRVGSGEISYERVVEQLIFTRRKRGHPFLGCKRCHRRTCKNCQRNPSPSEHLEREWSVPEVWGGRI